MSSRGTYLTVFFLKNLSKSPVVVKRSKDGRTSTQRKDGEGLERRECNDDVERGTGEGEGNVENNLTEGGREGREKEEIKEEVSMGSMTALPPKETARGSNMLQEGCTRFCLVRTDSPVALTFSQRALPLLNVAKGGPGVARLSWSVLKIHSKPK